MRDSKVLKATFWYTFSSFLLKGIGLITTPFFARILTQEEYGNYTNIATWCAIIAIVATLSLNAALVRGRFDYQEELDAFVSSNLLLGSLATVLCSGLILCNSTFFSNLFAVEEKYLFIICAAIFVSPAYDMFLNIQRFKYKFKLVVVLTIGIALSSIFLSFLLIYLLEDNLMARVLGTYAPTFVVSLVLYVFFLIKGHCFKLEYCKYSLVVAAPYVIHLLSGTILSSSDKAMITRLSGAQENALYSMAHTIALLASTVWSAMNNAFSPWLGEKLNEKNYVDIRKYSIFYIAIYLAGIAGILLIAPEMLLLLGGHDYMAAKYVIPPVLIGYIFILIYSLYVSVEQFEKKTLGMAIATSAAALINVITNAIFIPIYGYIAAAYTTLFCNVLLTIFHYVHVKKMHLNIVYNGKYILMVCLASVLSMPLFLWIYHVNIIRYIALLCYVLLLAYVAIKNKEKLLPIILRSNKL